MSYQKNTKNIILIGVACLLLGLFIGFTIKSKDTQQLNHVDMSSAMQHDMTGDMASEMKGMMAGLEGKTGDTFDKAFLSEMIIHHQGAVDMAQAVLATSKRPELLKLSRDIITAQTQEINMMKEWQKKWFGK
jgi:uncharacterized protein (DUF305 family)